MALIFTVENEIACAGVFTVVFNFCRILVIRSTVSVRLSLKSGTKRHGSDFSCFRTTLIFASQAPKPIRLVSETILVPCNIL